MKIPPFWTTERSKGIDGQMWRLRGISFSSMEEARERLEARRGLRAEFLRMPGGNFDDYRAKLRALDEIGEDEYSVLLLEPVVRQLSEDLVITRNRYGVQVLNSTSICFVDVDDVPLSFVETVRGWFGNKLSPEDKLLGIVRSLCEQDSSLGARVYRTHNGWRIMLTGNDLAPASPRMKQLFAALHADPLYVAMCERQQCWRARLTPKPYRVGITRFPRPVDSESIYSPESQEWIAKYESVCMGKAVCRLVDCMGCPILGEGVELHDQLTQAKIADLPLV